MINVNSLVLITAWIVIVLSIAIITKQRYPEQKELSRKIVHIGTGPIIPLAWWLNIPSTLAICVSVVVTIALIINQRFKVLNAVESVQRQTYGTVAYGLSITVLLIIFWPHQASAVCAGVLVMAFGDGLAGLIGRQLQSPSWTIFGQRKSIAGTLAMGVIGAITLLLISLINGMTIHPLQILGISGLAVCLEQIGPWGIDNLTVPIGVAFAWNWAAGL